MAYTEILLISEATLKNYSILNDNVSYSLVKPVTKAVQESRLIRLLGLDMYNEIISQVTNNTVSVPNAYILDNYITDILIWGTLKDLNVFLNTKMKNTGIVQTPTQNNNALSLAEGDYNATSYKYYEVFYSELLADYICENSSSYPLYCPETNNNINDDCPITF